MRLLLAALPLTVAAACSPANSGKERADADGAAVTALPGASAGASAAAATSAVASAASDGVVSRDVDEENDLYHFAYSYPVAAGVIAPLRAQLDAELAKNRNQLKADATEGKAEAAKDGREYRPYEAQKDWAVVADLPAWLSLSATLYWDSGGAHPNHGYDALVWDRRGGRRMAAKDLFTSPAALNKAIRARFCDLLDAERSKRRQAKVDRASGDQFDECIDPTESTLVLGSSNRKAFNRIGVLIGPYEAGPYVEGDYEITLPVTPAVLAAVKPEYRSSFVAQ